MKLIYFRKKRDNASFVYVCDFMIIDTVFNWSV